MNNFAVVGFFAAVGLLAVAVSFFRRQPAQGWGFVFLAVFFITAVLFDNRHSYLNGHSFHPVWRQENPSDRLNLAAACGFLASVFFMRTGLAMKTAGMCAGLVLIGWHFGADPRVTGPFAGPLAMAPGVFFLSGVWFAGLFAHRPAPPPELRFFMLVPDEKIYRKAIGWGLGALASLYLFNWILSAPDVVSLVSR